MKQILLFIFILTSFFATAQTVTVIGDSAIFTIPSKVLTQPVEESYDGFLRDSSNLVLYISELQTSLINAQANFNNLISKVEVVRKRALEIKKERKEKQDLQDFLQGAWVFEEKTGPLVTNYNVTISGLNMTSIDKAGTIMILNKTDIVLTGFFISPLPMSRIGNQMRGGNGTKFTLTRQNVLKPN